ncbi:MAG TPA: hypothetical protein VFO29_06305 [Candidatus Rubrimentiphilum sp.]|nr:hypothetical protein [Candidatus Rubrimentiphilum sp.]
MIATLILAALVSAPQTPQAAALLFLQPRLSHTHPSVHVTAATARYAVVHFTGAVIESSPASGYLLVQKFSFGWQVIDLSTGNSPFAVPGSARNGRDIGPTADVEAVRAHAARFPETIPFVRVIDGYAIMEWRGWGGGQNFYKKTPHGWKEVMGGGGAMVPSDLTAKGVPLAIAEALLKP